MSLKWADLLEKWGDLDWVRDRLEHRVGGTFSGLLYGFDGVDVPALKWDNLIILDACRADLFEAVCDLDVFDDYRRVKSRGSSTEEWVRKNWVDRTFPDLIYVTANPTVARYTPVHFHRRIDVFEWGFNEQQETVLPETMYRSVLDHFEGDKRLVAHFMQPHYPFYVADLNIDAASWHPGGDSDSHSVRNPWESMRRNDVSRDELVDAYRATLEEVLPVALRLAEELPGRSVVTSDHGNTYGRWAIPLPLRIYGHPTGFRYPELAHVPWGTIEARERDIVPGHVAEKPPDTDIVRERLEAFGYVNTE